MKEKIKPLKRLNKDELVELLTQAYKDYPFAESYGLRPETTKNLINASSNIFLKAKGIWIYGIWKDGKLVCASLSMNSKIKLSTLMMIKFIFSLLRILKWRIVRFITVMLKERPIYKEHNLELVSFGTLPAYQKQGFGRKMLHFLYNRARKEKSKGINLFTVKGRTAFHLYLKEGFKVEKEFTLFGGIPLCWMRKSFTYNE